MSAPPPDFSLRCTVHDDSVEAAVSGDLEMAAAFKLEPELDRVLATPGVRTLELDLAGVGFVNSAGLGALLALRDRAAQLDIGFRIARASEPVQRMLDLTGTRTTLGA